MIVEYKKYNLLNERLGISFDVQEASKVLYDILTDIEEKYNLKDADTYNIFANIKFGLFVLKKADNSKDTIGYNFDNLLKFDMFNNCEYLRIVKDKNSKDLASFGTVKNIIQISYKNLNLSSLVHELKHLKQFVVKSKSDDNNIYYEINKNSENFKKVQYVYLDLFLELCYACLDSEIESFLEQSYEYLKNNYSSEQLKDNDIFRKAIKGTRLYNNFLTVKDGLVFDSFNYEIFDNAEDDVMKKFKKIKPNEIINIKSQSSLSNIRVFTTLLEYILNNKLEFKNSQQTNENLLTNIFDKIYKFFKGKNSKVVIEDIEKNKTKIITEFFDNKEFELVDLEYANNFVQTWNDYFTKKSNIMLKKLYRLQDLF